MPGQHIAVVNDDPTFLSFMEDLLKEEGYPAAFWATGEMAFRMIRDRQPDVVALDIRMEAPDAGLVILEMMRLDRGTAHIPVIVCSADLAFLRMQLERLHALNCAVLENPFSIDGLLAMLAHFIGPPLPA
jgi:CheY-like chemotaxis protein